MKKWMVFVLAAAAAWAQDYTQRGFFETDFNVFPQKTANDSGNVVGDAMFQWDLTRKFTPWLTLSGGVQALTDTHLQTERTFHLDVQDRGLLRPAFEIRSLAATLHGGHVTAVLGKQFIRWGKADILNPTDRFAPRDYLDVVDNEFLGVLAARVTVEAGGNSLDLIWTPRFTPDRTPLLNQRWMVMPQDLPGSVRNAATDFPGGGQYGARVNHVGRGYEISGSFFEGYNHAPLMATTFVPNPDVVYMERFYPKIRMYGLDSAISLPWFTIKTEAGLFQSRADRTSPMPQSDDYIIYVAQAERQIGEWTLIGGYSGQTVLTSRGWLDFDVDRGLTRAFLGRASYNIGSRSNISVELAARLNGNGTWVRGEYTRLLASHWRATVDVVFIGGDSMDFLGQYRRNSHAIVKIRYSF